MVSLTGCNPVAFGFCRFDSYLAHNSTSPVYNTGEGESMKTKTKGDLAVGQSIAFYTKRGIEVLLPLGDKQKYDLVIEQGGDFHRVQCKYTSRKTSYRRYQLDCRVGGGNKSRLTHTKYKKSDFDIFLVYCEDGTIYEIPVDLIAGRSLIVVGSSKYEQYRQN